MAEVRHDGTLIAGQTINMGSTQIEVLTEKTMQQLEVWVDGVQVTSSFTPTVTNPNYAGVDGTQKRTMVTADLPVGTSLSVKVRTGTATTFTTLGPFAVTIVDPTPPPPAEPVRDVRIGSGNAAEFWYEQALVADTPLAGATLKEGPTPVRITTDRALNPFSRLAGVDVPGTRHLFAVDGKETAGWILPSVANGDGTYTTDLMVLLLPGALLRLEFWEEGDQANAIFAEVTTTIQAVPFTVDSKTVGPARYTVLTPYSGPTTMPAGTTVVEAKDLRGVGNITIGNGAVLVLKDCETRPGPLPGQQGRAFTVTGTGLLVLIRTNVDGEGRMTNGIQDGRAIIIDSWIRRTGDGIKFGAYAYQMLIRSILSECRRDKNLLADGTQNPNDPWQHADGIQCIGGRHGLVWRCVIDWTADRLTAIDRNAEVTTSGDLGNAALQWGNEAGSRKNPDGSLVYPTLVLDDMICAESRLYGGNYTVSVRNADAGVGPNVVFQDVVVVPGQYGAFNVGNNTDPRPIRKIRAVVRNYAVTDTPVA